MACEKLPAVAGQPGEAQPRLLHVACKACISTRNGSDRDVRPEREWRQILHLVVGIRQLCRVSMIACLCVSLVDSIKIV